MVLQPTILVTAEMLHGLSQLCYNGLKTKDCYRACVHLTGRVNGKLGKCEAFCRFLASVKVKQETTFVLGLL